MVAMLSKIFHMTEADGKFLPPLAPFSKDEQLDVLSYAVQRSAQMQRACVLGYEWNLPVFGELGADGTTIIKEGKR
eukprot:2975379-Amphidinium_carterae.1